MAKELKMNELDNVNGGLNYDGKFYSLSYGDCFYDSSVNERYMVIEDYADIEEGTHIDVMCLETQLKTYKNFGILMYYTYVGNIKGK